VKTSAQPEAYCAEMNCNWRGELPAVAKCPQCGSRQVRALTAEPPIAILEKALEAIGSADQAPGHVNYMSKSAMAACARAALKRAEGAA
jgi:hypothetical protein